MCADILLFWPGNFSQRYSWEMLLIWEDLYGDGWKSHPACVVTSKLTNSYDGAINGRRSSHEASNLGHLCLILLSSPKVESQHFARRRSRWTVYNAIIVEMQPS
jgi:hypothetical protein